MFRSMSNILDAKGMKNSMFRTSIGSGGGMAEENKNKLQ